MKKARMLNYAERKSDRFCSAFFCGKLSRYDDGSMRTALKKLGFHDAQETAVGATLVKRQYDQMVKEGKQDVIISSCCPSVNLMIQKHLPMALRYLADVLTPMQAHCRHVKQQDPAAKTIFIGPCIAKKEEGGQIDGLVDSVLTFAELSVWMEKQNVRLETEPDEANTARQTRARLFPTTGVFCAAWRAIAPNTAI